MVDDNASLLSGSDADAADAGATAAAASAANAGAGEGAGAAGASGAPAGNGAAGDAQASWWKSHIDGLDKSTAMSFQNYATRHKTPAEFAKSHVELNKALSTRIAVPGADAKAEEWNKVWDKLGRPKEPKEYKWTEPKEFPLDDTDKAYRDAMAGVFHRVGLNQNQLSEIEKAQYEQLKLLADARKAARETAPERTKRILAEGDGWTGEILTKNLSNANTAMINYAGQNGAKELANLQLADGSVLGAHPAFIRAWAKVGSERAEDDTEPNVFNVSAREGAKAEIDRIETESLKAGLTPASKDWPHARLTELYRKMEGSRNLGVQPFMRG